MTLAIFLSGAAGLIFQIAWLYECGLVFGNSVWAASIVQSSFMGGLALGNALVVRFERRIRFPRVVYAALETIVALAGVALTYALPNLTRIVAPLTSAVTERAWLANLIRLAVAFAILVVPATAMGATLPIVVGAIARGRSRLGGVLGHLYGWNTLGAVVGVVGAEVLLIKHVGIRGSGLMAAALDLSAAAIAIWCARRVEAGAPDEAVRKTAQPASPIQWRAAASAFLAGGALLGLELIWFRFLTMFVLSTTLAVSLMLASVLAAIAAGGLAASLWLKRPASAIPLVPVALALGSVTVLSYTAFQWLTTGTQIGEWYRVLWLAAALTAPTAFVSGAFFTALGDAMAREKPAAATATTAWLTLANTAGAMCGPLVAVFVLLPAFGIEGALFTLALVYGVIALVAPRPPGSAAPWRSPVVVVTALVFALLFITFPFGLMSGRYFVRSAQAYTDDGSRVVATREGSSDTILLMRQEWLGKPVYDRMVTNGFSMSGTAVPAMRYMRYFAYWPMLTHEMPLKKALVVCYGVGVTAGAVADIASLESIDVAEISPDVVAMSDVIYANGRPPLRDPRVRLHLEDGRNFLQTTNERFDLITGEPPPPRTPGAVNIYTREYFQLLHDRLAEGGIATYWVPVARPDPGTDVDTIIRAFCDVFDDCSLWNGTPFDLMLAGSRHATDGPVRLVQLVQDEAAFSKPWVTPGLESRLREVGFETPEEIGATFVGDAPYLRALTAHTPPLVDDFPQRLLPAPGRPSLSDPRYRVDPTVAGYFQQVIDPAAARERFANSSFARRVWPDALIAGTLAAFDDQRIVNRVLWEGGKPLRQIEDLHFLLTHTALRTLPLWILGSDDVKQRIAETSADRTGVVEYARALRALSGRDYAGAAALLAAAEQRGFHGAVTSALRAYALCRNGQIDAARDIARGIQAADPDEKHFWGWMATTFGVGTP